MTVLGYLTRKIVSEITYNVSSGTLNPTIPYLVAAAAVSDSRTVEVWAVQPEGVALLLVDLHNTIHRQPDKYNKLKRKRHFCRAMLCISAAYAVMQCVCVCVCVCVCHVRGSCQNE